MESIENKKKGESALKKFRGELLCEITGVKQVNAKEYIFLLNPQPPGLVLSVPKTVVQEWFPGKPLYLAISDCQLDVENIEAFQLHKKSIWKGTLQENDGSRISITGTLLPVQILPEIHRKVGNIWEKVIQLTVDYMEDHERAYDYVRQYLIRVLGEEPLQLKKHPFAVSSLENVTEAIRRMPQIQAVNKRLPTVEDLERWLCMHAVTALQKDLVFLKKGKLWFNLGSMIYAYLGILI